MTTVRHHYLVTFYFRYARLSRRVMAYSVAQAIQQAGRQVFDLGLQYECVIAEAI